MSKVSYQSVVINKATTEEPFFYIGALIDSESGYLLPHLVTSTEQLNSIFGTDFEFHNMYQNLIENDIACCLLPVITRESQYNVCSLRLSNGFITVSHPKKDKEYNYVSLSNIIETVFNDIDEVDVVNPYGIDFYPIIGIEVDNELVKSRVTYDGDTIHVKFTQKCSGTITIESFPQIDEDPEYIEVNHFGLLEGGGTTPSFEIKTPNQVIPEIVVTRDDTDIRLGERVECHVEISDTADDNGQYMTTITPKIPEFDCRYRIDIRTIPSSLLISQQAQYQTDINHNSERKPIFKIEKDGVESWASVQYRSRNFAIVSVSEPDNVTIRYNVVTTESDFDFQLLSTSQTTMNLILDFTNVSYETLRYQGSITEPSNYFIIGTVTEDCLVATSEWHQVPTDYYDVEAVYILQDGEGQTNDDKKSDTLQKFKDWYNDRYSNSCYNLKDLILQYIQAYCDKYGEPAQDQYGHQVFIDSWKEDFINKSFIEDFWLESNEYVAAILTKLVSEYSETNIITTANLLEKARDTIVNDNNKLIIDFALPITDKNHYKMDGIRFDSSSNMTQDKLCEFTEKDKVVEFYSKIKGPVGQKISVTIEKVNFYDGLYYITISNDIIVENYTVRLYDLGPNIPIENIYFDDISQLSQLVEVRIYNYWLDKNTLIDSTYFSEEEYGVPYNTSNVRDNSELVLPIGTFYLDRITEEEITYDSRLDSLKIWKESDWYPDLFLVPKLPNNLGYPKAILDLVDFKTNVDDSIFSQALINLEFNNLNTEWLGTTTTNLVSDNNRIIYAFGQYLFEDEWYPLITLYVKNFIKQRFLRLPVDSFIYRPFDLIEGNCIALYDEFQIFQEVVYIEKLNDGYAVLKSKVIKNPDKVTETEYRGWIDATNQTFTLEDGTAVYSFTSIMDILVNNRINFLFYDNLMYYYESVIEPLNQDNQYFIRFISSKYTREVYKIRHSIPGIKQGDLSRLINNINDNCLRNLTLLASSVFKTQVDGESALILFEVTVSSIVNKTYKLNYVLNIN